MYKTAFIGDIDLIKGFKALGARVFDVKIRDMLPSIFEKISNEDYKVIFILENLAAASLDIIERYKDRFISITIIPDYRKDFDIRQRNIKNAIIEAIGADILT